MLFHREKRLIQKLARWFFFYRFCLACSRGAENKRIPPLSGMVNENIQNGMQNLEPKAEALPLLGMSSFFSATSNCP